MSLYMRKPTIWIFNQAVQSQDKARSLKLWIQVEKRNCIICVAKTKTQISCAVTAQLICVFVFAHANLWFSHAKAKVANSCVFMWQHYVIFSKLVPNSPCHTVPRIVCDIF